MKITNKNIMPGMQSTGLDIKDYAKYRDIYPSVFYEIAERGLCVANQRV
ncbi:MAG: hypothetical protein ACLRL6_07015 [Clostridium sp.]